MKTHKLLVNGSWRTARETIPDVNPFTGRTIARVCVADSTLMDAAIDSAERAAASARKLSAHERREILKGIAAGIGKRKEEIARMITAESGKPIAFARAEADRSVLTFTLAAEEAGRLGGEVIPLDITGASKGYIGIVRPVPLGAIAAISPFNFPINLVAHKVAPAIAAGNTVVLKPPSQTPMTALLLGEIAEKAGVPAGMLNVVPAPVPVADRLVTDPRIKMLTFTGSPAVGWDMKARAGKKKITLELGGNAGAIVHDDANLDWAVPRLALGAFANAGQVCISVQRIYVQERIYDAFVKKFTAHAKKIAVGDPMDEKTVVGPLIDKKAADRVEEWIAEAHSAGAKILAGGRRKGNVIEPTVISDAARDLKVSCLEVFGPVVTLTAYKRFEEAVAAVDDSVYGLQAGVFTRDIGRIAYAFDNLEVGGVVINDYPMFRVDNMPYGGVKDSGFGREGLRYAIQEMTEPRLLVINQNV